MTSPFATDRQRVWRLLPGQALRHHGWDGSFLLYNDCSGDTHLLDAGAMRVLLSLGGGPRDEQALDACYAGSSAAPAPGNAPLSEVLGDLAALSLIVRDPC